MAREDESIRPGSEALTLRAAQYLVHLSRVDWSYADLYLHRAELVLSRVWTREQLAALRRERDGLLALKAEVERAVSRQDWRGLAALAGEAGRARSRVDGAAALVETADSVYGTRTLEAGGTVLALSGLAAGPIGALRSELGSISDSLKALCGLDPDMAGLYRVRGKHLDALALTPEDAPAIRVDPAEERAAILRAAERGNFAEVERLARVAAVDHQDATGRVRVPQPERGAVAGLSLPPPPEAVAAAGRLGLERRTVAAWPDLNAYMSCRCSDHPTLCKTGLEEGDPALERHTCGHACPPGIPPSLRSNLDLLMVHAFLTSGGTRYLPWFGEECVLVEMGPEQDDDFGRPLIDRLRLPGRRGLTRAAIDDALLRHGVEICEDLGLDPVEFRLVCIPFDAYTRLAEAAGWGTMESWTHMDGYQVTQGLKLLGLVGGDARFGGPHDLCSVARDYESPRVAARFAIVRRVRFVVRDQWSER